METLADPIVHPDDHERSVRAQVTPLILRTARPSLYDSRILGGVEGDRYSATGKIAVGLYGRMTDQSHRVEHSRTPSVRCILRTVKVLARWAAFFLHALRKPYTPC